MNTTAHLGIDISKAKIDVALTCSGRKRVKVFRNDAEGWRHLIRWLTDQADTPVHACLEATGRYGDGVALALHEAGHVVSVVNPAQIKSFARTKLGRNKTDRLDAVLIGEYCQVFLPPPWSPRLPCGNCAISCARATLCRRPCGSGATDVGREPWPRPPMRR